MKWFVKVVLPCCLIAFVFFSQSSVASTRKVEEMRCVLNDDCPSGFVCVNTSGSDFGTGVQNGYCEPILPIRQICLFHLLITDKFGKPIVVLVVISMGLSAIFGKLGYKSLITFFVGTICLFGSYQVVYLLTGYKQNTCNMVDTSIPPGFHGDD